jgi:mannose-6-phosphate isomerase-like protein (cupin superfamily)
VSTGYSIVARDDADDWMAEYPGFGEMRSFTRAAGCDQVALTWRQMPSGTGGKGSYGHRHPGQDEVYLVIRGTVQFKLGDDVVEVGPRTAVRVGGDVFRSVHNEGPEEAELVIVSTQEEDAALEKTDADFWPE